MNAAIHEKGNDDIAYFVLDCKKDKGGYVGTNCRLTINPSRFDVVWTPDIATQDEFGNWDKKVSELTVSEDKVEPNRITYQEYEQALKFRKVIDNMSYQELDNDAKYSDLLNMKDSG